MLNRRQQSPYLVRVLWVWDVIAFAAASDSGTCVAIDARVIWSMRDKKGNYVPLPGVVLPLHAHLTIAAYCSNFAPTQNFRQKWSSPNNHFCTNSEANECLTTLSPTVFTQLLRLRRYERKQIEKRRFCTNAVTLIQNFRYKGSPPPIIFARLVRPVNALQLCR